MKYVDLLTPKQIEAALDKLGGVEGVLRFLDESPAISEPPRRWSEKDGVITFSVTSDGTTGPEWVPRLEARGLPVGPYAKSVLFSSDFKPTSGITTQVVVLRGVLWSSDQDRTTKNVRKEADRRELAKPNAEVACLIRVMFSNEEIEVMGLWGIVAMHDPIEDSDGRSYLLAADRRGDYSLSACFGHPVRQWGGSDGFAFAGVSQVA